MPRRRRRAASSRSTFTGEAAREVGRKEGKCVRQSRPHFIGYLVYESARSTYSNRTPVWPYTAGTCHPIYLRVHCLLPAAALVRAGRPYLVSYRCHTRCLGPVRQPSGYPRVSESAHPPRLLHVLEASGDDHVGGLNPDTCPAPCSIFSVALFFIQYIISVCMCARM